MSTRTRIWLLIVSVALVAGALLSTAVPDEPPVDPPLVLPWVVLAAAFALAELAVVHVQVRRDSHSFSLTEAVLVVGLCLTAPVPLVLALVVGAAVVFAGRRRQPAVKVFFNLALYALVGSLATITYAAVGGGADPAGPRGWLAALLAVLVATVVSDLAIFTVISISENTVDWRQLPQMSALSVPFALGTAAVALVGVRSLWQDPASLVLLAVPAMLTLGAYRAYCRAGRERSNMQFLHQVSTMLPRGGELGPALAELLAANRTAFRVGTAELCLIGPGGETTTTRSVDGAEPLVLTASAADGTHQRLLELVQGTPVVRTSGDGDRHDRPANHYARSRGFTNMMAAAVVGDRLHGIVLVADRYGDVSSFDDGDAALFTSLAHQVGQVLDNGQLEQSLRQVTELKEELAHRARHDALTGLASRGYFLEWTQRAIDSLARNGGNRESADSAGDGHGLTVLYLDLDGFKSVNDSLGHDAGDMLLQIVASRLRGCVREQDLVARLGGDEFAVLLGHRDEDSDSVIATAERIRSRVSEPVEIDGQLVSVGPSIGIASIPLGAPTFTVDELVHQADAAMYAAKRAGGHQHAFYSTELERAAPPAYSGAALAAALDEDQIVVRYQPIVDLSSGVIVGAEALVRWQHPADGLLGPDQFIPLAEQTGLITELGGQVLEKACADARRWLDRSGGHDLFITVNLSSAQLVDDDLVDRVAAATTKSGLPPSALVLEITETMLMRDPHSAADTLGQLKARGVQVAVDDFGTGYSSLAYLRRFPVDMLKIATEFTHGLGSNPDDDIVTHAIVQLAGALGLRTVAEGIETPAQHLHLQTLSCALGQGYLFSSPVEADQILALLAADPPRLLESAGSAAWSGAA